MRAALAVAVIVALGTALERPVLTLAALGALLTCLADPGGPLMRRLAPLAGFGLAGAAILGAFGLVRGLPPPIELPLAGLALFVLSFLRIYGLTAQQLGNLLSVVLILALDAPLPDFGAALTTGFWFLAGSAWAILLTLCILPLHPFAPVRAAVAEAWQALAGLAGNLARASGEPPGAAWDAHALVHRRAVRTAIEAARPLLMDAVSARGRSGGRAAQSLIRLAAAEQTFGALIGLSELLEGADAPTRQRAARFLVHASALFRAVARAIRADHPLRADKLRRLTAALLASLGKDAGQTPLLPLARTIGERLVLAGALSGPQELAPGAAIGAAPSLSFRARLGLPLAANLQFSSTALRHALRVGVVATPALAATARWTGPLGHWLTIALLLTMQPYFALTWVRALERIGGTVAGGLVAAGIAVIVQSPLAIAAALFPLSVIAFTLRRVSYGLFMAALTPMIVVLVDIAMPGTTETAIVLDRALYTLVGGVLAVAGTLILWPSFEPERLRQEVRSAILAHGRYGRAVFGSLTGEASATEAEAARRAAGLASNNLEAALQRAFNEPARRREAGVEAALLVDACLRRIAGRLAAMQQDPALPAALPGSLWEAWRGWVFSAMQALAQRQAVPPHPALPPGTAGQGVERGLLRISGQVELLDQALARLTGGSA